MRGELANQIAIVYNEAYCNLKVTNTYVNGNKEMFIMKHTAI